MSYKTIRRRRKVKLNLSFEATSGNTASVQVFDNDAVDVAWRDSPALSDIRQCDAWIQEILGGKIVSTRIEDDQIREAIIQGWEPQA